MAVRKGATLLELLMVLVIISFLSTASFKALQAIKIREFKAKEQTRLSLESQISVNIIANYLNRRIAYTTIGYDPAADTFEYIGDITDATKSILEFFVISRERYYNRDYSEFFDMETKSGAVVHSPNTNAAAGDADTNLIFSGSFDRSQSDSNDYINAFGWHENQSSDSFDVSVNSSGDREFTDTTLPKFLYERYFLSDGAVAIARGADIDTAATCISSLNIAPGKLNNTLFLFFGYRPWKGERFCADPNGTGQTGSVSILMQDIAGFNFREIDHTIRITLDVNKSIRGSSPVHFSKLKVVF